MRNKAATFKVKKGKDPAENLRFLLLEDNPTDAEMILYELGKSGLIFTSMVVDTEEAFKKALQEHCPNIILSDYDLPQYEGVLALTYVKDKYPEIPFILVSGAVTENRAIEVLTSGARDYVLKNRLSRLIPAVKRALAEAQEHKARAKAEKELRRAHRELEQRVRERTASLQASENRYRSLFNTINEIMEINELVYDDQRNPCDWRTLDVNPAYLKSTGKAREEVIGRLCSEIYGQDVPKAYLHYFDKVVKTGKPIQYETYFEPLKKHSAVSSYHIGGRQFAMVITDLTKMKQAEDQLLRSDEILQAILHSAPAGVIITDREGRILLSSSEAEALLGGPRSGQAHNPNKVCQLSEPDGSPIPEASLPLSLALEGQTIVDREILITRSDGSQSSILTSATPLPRNGGSHWGALTIFQDITKRRQWEESVEESEEKYRLIFENSFSGIMIADSKGWMLKVNPAAEQILGMSEKEIKDLGKYGLVDQSDPRFQQRIKEGKDTFFGEMNWKRKNGSTFPVEIASAHFRNRKGQEFVSLVFQDITLRKNLEQILMQSEKRFREAADAMPQIVWTATPKGFVNYFNIRHQQFPGIKRDSSGFWQWRSAVHPEDLPATDKAWKKAFKEKIYGEAEHRLLDKDGNYRWYLSRGVPILENGSLVKWLGTTTDIHDLKESEGLLKKRTALLEEANKELESFSYSVSHDLRAPLRAIDGFSRMLLEGNVERDQETNRRLIIIRENALKMDGLIKDLLDFSKSGRTQPSKKKIDMDRLVEELWREQVLANSERLMELKKTKLPEGFGDEALIRQILTNLLANAVKFTRERKKAIIEAGGESNRKEAIYYIRDNGAGFSMKYAEKLFGVFQRLHPESQYEGTGIGLAIVQRIIHRHGGRVWAEGRVDEGATFYFLLPSVEAK